MLNNATGSACEVVWEVRPGNRAPIPIRFILPLCDINRDAKTRHHRNDQGIHVLLFRPILDKRRS